jgi:hypothetical protein
VFNNTWATVYNQTFTNSPGSITVPSLSTGTYHVNVRFSTSSWTSICEKMVDAAVSTTGSANLYQSTAMEKDMATRQTKISLLSSNPFRETIKLSVELDRKQKVNISIADVQGRILYRNTFLYAQGRQEIILVPGAMRPGTYLLKLSGDTFIETKKIMKE